MIYFDISRDLKASEEEKLGTKLTQLRLAAQRTGKVLDAGKREAIERHLKALQTTISETDRQKCTVEAVKIGKKDDLADISDWNTEIEVKINEAEDEVNRLQRWLDGKRIEEENYAREEKFKFEVKLEETKLEMQAKIQGVKPGGYDGSKAETGGSTKGMSVRLPKINITLFDGSYMDWPRFWGQFTETVDKAHVAAISKFTYLCGFLGPNIQISMEKILRLLKHI